MVKNLRSLHLFRYDSALTVFIVSFYNAYFHGSWTASGSPVSAFQKRDSAPRRATDSAPRTDTDSAHADFSTMDSCRICWQLNRELRLSKWENTSLHQQNMKTSFLKHVMPFSIMQILPVLFKEFSNMLLFSCDYNIFPPIIGEQLSLAAGTTNMSQIVECLQQFIIHKCICGQTSHLYSQKQLGQ